MEMSAGCIWYDKLGLDARMCRSMRGNVSAFLVIRMSTDTGEGKVEVQTIPKWISMFSRVDT